MQSQILYAPCDKNLRFGEPIIKTLNRHRKYKYNNLIFEFTVKYFEFLCKFKYLLFQITGECLSMVRYNNYFFKSPHFQRDYVHGDPWGVEISKTYCIIITPNQNIKNIDILHS